MTKEECIRLFERVLNQQASEQEVARLSNWLAQDQQFSGWWEQQFILSDNKMDAETQRRIFESIEANISTQPEIAPVEKTVQTKRFRIPTWIKVAAVLLIAILPATGVYYFTSTTNTGLQPLIVEVSKGQKANITLPDGSKVWLNSDSKLTYQNDFNKEKRELKLNGEAYFEVAPNPAKPFTVYADDLSVRALGTAFGIKAYKEDKVISSILMHGSVLVKTPDGDTILVPNERVQYNKELHKKNVTTVTNATDFTGWIHNELRFENESLEEIAKTIKRIYNVNVVFNSERLKKQRYTGTINNNSLESIFNIISLTSPVVYKVDSQKVILFENADMMSRYNP